MIGCLVALQGEISAQQIEWLSGIESKNMNGCGRFTMAEDLSSIADITRVDLSTMDSLEGDVRVWGDNQGAHPLADFQEHWLLWRISAN